MSDRQVQEVLSAFHPLAKAANHILNRHVVLTRMGGRVMANRPGYIESQDPIVGFAETEIDAIHDLLKGWFGEYSVAFEAARLAERTLESLDYDRRPVKPVDYMEQVATARTAFVAADARFEIANKAVVELREEIAARAAKGAEQ